MNSSEISQILRDHARSIDMECAPEDSDIWQAASHIEAQDKLIAVLTAALERIKDMPSVFGLEEATRQQWEGRLNEQCRWIAREALSQKGTP